MEFFKSDVYGDLAKYGKLNFHNKTTAAFVMCHVSIYRLNKDYAKTNFSISSSGLPIPAIPKLSTRTLATFGDKNAGSVGPR